MKSPFIGLMIYIKGTTSPKMALLFVMDESNTIHPLRKDLNECLVFGECHTLPL
jgi:hypothetical protein